ncbi:universal stress protein [Deinococcus alpinitundrae]|uniref:universal stress protein n=1 Tax=Deinococcus alpinitundrae TaxID=468913 RepID=UPI00137A068A|nr:universal stress protein [Deinococcus alpinitundrae]
MFNHILVTTDGSALSHLALPFAADLARKYDSAVTLLYIVPPQVIVAEGIYAFDYPAEHQRLVQEGAHFLEHALKALNYEKTQVVRFEREDLKTEQAIVHELERTGADLLVMSTHGRSGLAHLFLGSVAESVLRQVKIPVLLIQAPAAVAPQLSTDHQPVYQDATL